MAAFRKNIWFRRVASPKLTLSLLILFGLAIAAATFIESGLGTDAAKELVYNALWFEIMLGLFVVNLIFALGRWWPFRPRLMGFVLIHIAVIVILTAAGMTRFLGFEGSMFIREGGSSGQIYSRDDYIQLTLGEETGSYPVRLFRAGDPKISRDVTVAGEKFKVAVTRFWPRYAEEYLEGEGGPPALHITAVGTGGERSGLLQPGGLLPGPGERITYTGAAGVPAHAARYGHLAIEVGGVRSGLDVGPGPERSVELAGYTVVLKEFNADFRLGAAPPPVPTMSNPMIRLELSGPDGSREERTFFPYHPEFARRTPLVPGAVAAVKTDYLVHRTLAFTGRGQNLQGVCSLGLIATGDGGASEQTIGAGEAFPARPGTVYRAVTGDFNFTLDKVLESAVLQPVDTDDPDAPEAVRIEVTDPGGAVASAVVAQGIRKPIDVLLGQRPAGLAYGPVKIALPYRLMLDDFVVRTYPGSSNPVDFESQVRLFDEERGIQGAPARIFMNHPLTHRGYKHFQSSFDEDHKGTVLTVNYDPGKIPTYVGYALITLGFVLVFLKDLIWKPRRKSLEKEGGAA